MLRNHACVAALICMLLLFAIPIIAQEPTSDNSDLIVREISITGLNSLDESLIRDLIQTKVGEEISPEKLTKDIKEIYKTTEAFSDIAVDVQPLEDGLKVEYTLTENPKVKSDIQIIGNENLGHKKIKSEIILKKDAFYSEPALWKSTQNISELYIREGYYLAKVDSEVVPNEADNTVSVTFTIAEGERIKIQQVNYIGNHNATHKDLRKVMATREGKRFRDEALEHDLEKIINYYYDRGFLYAKVVDTQKRFTDDKIGIIIDITIEEGPQFRIGKHDIVFMDEMDKRPFSEEKIRSMFVLGEGDIFNKSQFAEDINTIFEAYNNEGYILAQIIPDPLRYHSEKALVDITMRVSEGDIIAIGNVDIDGLEKTKELVIRRELNRLDIKRGEQYNVQNLRTARQKIFTIGPFIRGVDFRLRPGSEINNKDLIVQIVETPQTGMFSLFGGYGTEGGILGGVEVGTSNLFGKAYRIRVKGELGTRKRRTGEISFHTPWIFNDPTSLGISLYSRQRTRRLYGQQYAAWGLDDWYADKRYGGSITLGRPITKNIESSIRFRDENGYIEWPESLLSDEGSVSDTWSETRSVTAFLSRDTRDYRLSLFNPISGSHNSFSFEYSGGVLGADNQFQKFTYNTSWFFETWKSFILATQLKMGYLRADVWNSKGGVDANKIWRLSFDRYFLGGIDTTHPIRGYENWSIIPEYRGRINPNFGGNKMYYLNLEYRYPVRSDLMLVTFFDMGQTWNEDTTNIFRDFHPYKSIGAGVRFELPAMGMIMRLEYGYGFDRRGPGGEEEPGGKFHFSMGPAF